MCFTYSLQLAFWALMPAICMGFLLSRWDLFRSHCTHHPPSTCIHLLQSFRISVLSEFWGQLHIRPGKPQSWTCRFLQGRQLIRHTWPKRKVCQAYFHKWTKREKTAWLPYYRLISGRVILDLQEQSGSETKEDGEQIRILKDLINRSSPCESFTI